MAAFIGTHRHTLDDKGRVSVPAQFRRQLTAENLYLNVGLEGCLVLYPSQRWLELEEKLLALPRNKKNRFFVRSFAENVKAVSVDSQGRISIPADLAESAGITGEIMFLGKFDTMELWQPERYSAYIADTEFSCEEIAEDLDLPL
ncbi:MAG: division/cell wall cluster transcriptional repressor MraZ [Candidatus Sabulitectum sp.]|nr:division/cell wall cluster transcriptional repressor MraZ [Candidatus Sabulitectum sp.]